MSSLYLRESDVAELLDMPLAIDVMQQAFAALAEGRADNSPRVRVKAPGIVLHSMSAAAEYLGLVGWKQYTTTRGGARFHVGLYDQQSGELLALVQADRLGQLRTGAVSGLAARLLALPGAAEVGIFGSGWQARSQLAAVAAARPLRRAVVYSRSPQRRESFAAEMSRELGLDVQPVEQPQQAARDLPIVITATTSRAPILAGDWLAAGTLLCAIGSNWLEKAEIDADAVRRAALVVCDSVACCRREAGDLAQAADAHAFDWERAVDLADVVAGRARRGAEDDVVIFKSVGMALEDVALGGKLIELARARGVGETLEL